MTYRAVIFDRDGVLLDFDLAAAAAFFEPLLSISLEELIEMWREWGRRSGFPVTLAEERRFWQGVWQFVAEKLNLRPSVQRELQQFNYTSILFAYPDARPALEWAHRHGLRVGVLSNFSLASIDASLEAVGLAELVDVAAAAPVIGVPKPHPEAYHYVLQRLEARPAECLFFDNKPLHVEGARALGMQAFLVDREGAGDRLSDGVVCDLLSLSTIVQEEHG